MSSRHLFVGSSVCSLVLKADNFTMELSQEESAIIKRKRKHPDRHYYDKTAKKAARLL